MNEIPVIGFDLGYGHIKVAGPGYRASFPAVVAEPDADAEPTGLLEWGTDRFLVGKPALTLPYHRYSTTADKINDSEELAKYLVALAMAAIHYDTDVLDVATGLPPAHYKDKAMRQQLVDNMGGRFTFSYEGRRHDIAVRTVSVDPQAGAAFFDYLLLDDGAPDLSNKDLNELRSVTIDIGHKTTDVSLMAGRTAAMGSRSLMTVDMAVWSAYDAVSNKLALPPYSLDIDAAKIDSLIRSNVPFRLAGQVVPLKQMVMDAARPIARAIEAKVRRHCEDVRLWDVALLVGGGASLFGQVLGEALGVPVRIQREPQFANAAGYFKRQIEQE